MGTSPVIRFALAACTLCLAVTACIPVQSDSGGTRPPPVIDAGGTGIDTTDGGTDGQPDGESAMVFDVVVQATSLTVSGMAVEGTLTVVSNASGNPDRAPPARVTLEDNVNDFTVSSAATGIAGGVFLTAGEADPFGREGGFFDLTVADDGTVSAVFGAEGVAGDNPNLFVLQGGGVAFEPGVIGITYEVRQGSSFSFRIDGDRVTGNLDLNGVPINEAADVDTYTGTFSGQRRAR